ncbi:MAG TPA: 3-hydroxyacyl-CoA dehydrogenase family protein [Longimicrobiales bacterium]|nr:3-hydroxyacyl-CoA dehydrogenase family protein [Longimicrobiales bacterium]
MSAGAPADRPGRVAVIGAGTMGHGIAQVAAMAGYAVELVDTTAERVQTGLERVRANLDEGVRRDKVSPAARETALANLNGITDIAAAAHEADLVIEAVPEQLALKVNVLARAAESAPDDALLASNTSGLSITEMQRALPGPARVVGLHFFNPVHIMALVEVVRGRDTSDAALEAALAFARRLGKEPIVVNDSPGFASSRLGVALGLEAMRMLEEGVASAADIDRAMELGYRHPMGPLRLTDLVGLDVRLDIARHLHETLGGERFHPPAILERMVAEGRLGRKSGRGFYDWND